MPIDTTIEGDPGAIHNTATWLRSTYAPAVKNYADLINTARRNAGSDWDGDASQAFQGAMTGLAKRGDDLDTSSTSTATKLDQYAGSLKSAQDHMLSAREIATAGGLTLTPTQILEPGPAPSVPARPTLFSTPTIGGPTASAQLNAYNSALTASVAQAAQAAAYAGALVEAADANTILKEALDALGPQMCVSPNPDVQHGFIAATAAGNSGSELFNRSISKMRGKAATLTSEAELHNQWYLTAPGGSVEALAYEKLRYTNALDSAQSLRSSGDLEFAAGRSLGGKVPVVGLVITAAAVGYDIHEGKPASSAIVGGVGGVVGGVIGGAVVGTAAFVGAPVIAAVAVVTGAGVLAGWGAESAWNAWVSDDVRKKIDDGIGSTVDDIASAPGTAWNAIP